jgi:hypothetical protein
MATARNLGVWLDSTMSFDQHVETVRRVCYCHIRRLARIRRYLTSQSAAIIAAAIVSGRLDYCNSLLVGTSAAKKLQLVQNSLARVVFRIPRIAHVSLNLMKLHWLPIKQRIDFKVALITWKGLNIKQPIYTYLSC